MADFLPLTFPTEPTLTEPTLQALLTLTVPDAPTLQTPTFSATAPTAPDNSTLKVLPFVYVAYANLIQDEIDANITDLSAYALPDANFIAQWNFEKEKILRKYDTGRKKLLRENGARNYSSMPGHIMRNLMELSLAEKRELAEMALKLLEDDVAFSFEQIEYALKAGIESDAIRFDSHHKLQTANFEAASFILKAGFDSVSADIDKYNETMRLISIELEQAKNETLQQMQLLQEFELEIRAAGLPVEIDSLLMEAYKAGIDYVVEKAGMQLVQYQAYLIQAEVLKNEARLGVAESELALAKMEGITAEYESYKATGRMTMAQLESFKQTIETQKIALDLLRAEVTTAKEQLAIELEHSNEEMAINHMKLQKAREDLAISIVQARDAIPEAEINAAGELIATIDSVTATIVDDIINTANTIGNMRLNTENEVVTAIDNAEKAGEVFLTTTMSLAEFDRQDAMQAAAEAAANATVRSKFYHVAGD